MISPTYCHQQICQFSKKCVLCQAGIQMSFSLHYKQFLDEFSEKFLFNFYEKDKATKDSIKMKLQRRIYDPVKDV